MMVNFMEFGEGMIMGIFEEWIWSDCLQCYDYVMVEVNHIIEAVEVYNYDDKLTFENVLLVLHKSPLVFYECDDIYYDALEIYQNVEGMINGDALEYLNLAENLLINWYDVS